MQKDIQLVQPKGCGGIKVYSKMRYDLTYPKPNLAMQPTTPAYHYSKTKANSKTYRKTIE
jgi:hypothetical protein